MRWTVGTTALALAAWAGSAGAQALPTDPVAALPASGTLLEVTAEGRATRVPDLATVRAGVTNQAATAAAALADNSARMARVLAAVRRAGVAERDLSTAAVLLQPQVRYADNQPPQVTGYQATNSVAVRFRDVGRAGPVLDALVAAGANQVDGPSLSLADPDAALDEARRDAVTRARARADLYARAAGMRVERIASITEGPQDAGGRPGPGPLYRLAVAAPRAPTEIAPGETDVTATVNARFVLR